MNIWKLKQPIHRSWLIAWLCLGIIGGTVTVFFYGAGPFLSLIWMILGLCVGAVCLWRGRVYCAVILVMSGGVIGMWRGSQEISMRAPLHDAVGRAATLRGEVVDDVERPRPDEQVLHLAITEIDGRKASGMLWGSTSDARVVKRGDRMEINGHVGDGFGSFTASMYRADILSLDRPDSPMLAFRDWFSGYVHAVLPGPEASLGLGFLTGQQNELPMDVEESMRIAGLTHIVVASGYNLTILVRLARRAFVRVSRYGAMAAGSCMVIVFAGIAGASPSMSRAGMVALLCLAAWYYGRSIHPLVLLPFVAAASVLFNPGYAWGDVGWMLSFAAFAGVMVAAPIFTAYFFGSRKPGVLRQLLVETTSAWLMTLPVIAAVFGEVSVIAILANLVVLPFIPLAMLVTFATGVTQAVLPFMAPLVGMPGQLLLGAIIESTNWFAAIPWAVVTLSVDWTAALVFYVFVAGALVYMKRKAGASLRAASIVE